MRITLSTLFYTLIIFTSILSFGPLMSYRVMAQSSMVDSNASISPEAGALLKKILNASSFSNIQTISFVPGIEVSGVDVGDSDISVTLKQIPSEAASSKSNASTPVTVTAVRLPGSSVKDVLSLVEASAKLRGENTSGPLAGMMEQMGSLLGATSNASSSTRPLQSLMQLGQNLQMGVGNIVGGDWKTPRTVTTGLMDLGELFGLGSSNPSPHARAHFIMVFVVPYIGKTSLGSVPLK